MSSCLDKVKSILMALTYPLLCGCGTPEYPLSDHYDGRKFFNSGGYEEPGFWQTVKLLAGLRYKKWLDAALGLDQVAVTFVNHATVLIQLPGLNILTDPMWSERASPLGWVGPKRVREPGIDFESLPRIDLVIVSHNHYDHLDLAILGRLNQRFSPRMLVPLGNKRLLRSQGIEKVEELDWWDTTAASPGTSVMFTPAQHFSSRRALRSQHDALGELFDQVAWAPDLLRRRRRVFRSLQGNSRSLRTRRYRSFADRGLRAAMVHEGVSHESGGGRSGPCGPAVPAVDRHSFRNVSTHGGRDRCSAARSGGRSR